MPSDNLSLRGAQRRSNLLLRITGDCFAPLALGLWPRTKGNDTGGPSSTTAARLWKSPAPTSKSTFLPNAFALQYALAMEEEATIRRNGRAHYYEGGTNNVEQCHTCLYR